MIIYSYKCDECGHVEDFEFMMEEKKPKKLACPSCKKMSMYRIFGDSSIHIPFQWTQDSFEFDKRPRKNRKYK